MISSRHSWGVAPRWYVLGLWPTFSRRVLLANRTGVLFIRNRRITKSTVVYLWAKGLTHTSEGQRPSIRMAQTILRRLLKTRAKGPTHRFSFPAYDS